MKIIGDKVIFSTGTEKYANNGIIGISPLMGITQGYDGGFYQPDDGWTDEHLYDLTKAEQVELAEYMVSLWTKFKEVATQ